MPTPSHHRARVGGTVGAAVAHGGLSALGMFNLLDYTVPTRYVLIAEVGGDHRWVWIHGLIAIALMLSLIRPYWRPWKHSPRITSLVGSLAFGAMAGWSFFALLWGMSSIRPVSLAGPLLGFVVAAGEHLLANAWTRGTHNKDR